MQIKRCVPLDWEAEKVCEESAVPPLIFQLPPAQGREVLEKLQDSPVYRYPAKVFAGRIDAGKWGQIRVYLTVPEQIFDVRRVILYVHGGGWVFGSFHTHEKLVRELAARSGAMVVFPEYTRSPEAKYPTAAEECYFILSHLSEVIGSFFSRPEWDLGNREVIVAGDSAGGNLAIALAFLSKQRKGPKIHRELLYYPVTNACFDTPTYREFAVNYYLYRKGMEWFWNQYTLRETDRHQATVSPLCASLEQLKDFPKTMIVNGQADVLRSEGEAFGEKLRRAGADVTAVIMQGTIHDFVMLNALDESNACRTAMDASVAWLTGTRI